MITANRCTNLNCSLGLGLGFGDGLGLWLSLGHLLQSWDAGWIRVLGYGFRVRAKKHKSRDCTLASN